MNSNSIYLHNYCNNNSNLYKYYVIFIVGYAKFTLLLYININLCEYPPDATGEWGGLGMGPLIFQKLPLSHIFLVYGSRMCLMTLFFNITKIIEDVCMKVM